MKQYFKVTPAVYMLLRRGDEILLLQRANTVYMEGFYSVPAGHVEANESAIVAAIREAKEEVGLDLKADDLKLVHTMHRRVDASDKGDYEAHERVELYFEVLRWEGEPLNAEPEKCSDLRWNDIHNLPKNVVPEIAYVLSKVAANETYSDFNF